MSEERKEICKCPLCGAGIVRTGKVIQCETNRSEKQDDGSWVRTAGCGFKMFGSACEHNITDEEAAGLIAGKAVHIEGMKSKKGKEFACDLMLKDEPENEFYRFDFMFNND